MSKYLRMLNREMEIIFGIQKYSVHLLASVRASKIEIYLDFCSIASGSREEEKKCCHYSCLSLGLRMSRYL